jgi:CheY-like chemotaxis protein
LRDQSSLIFSVLIVHSRKPLRASIRRLLEGMGHDVAEALDAPGGLAIMDGEEIDVVLVDLEGTGIATARAIRMDSAIPIVGVFRRAMPKPPDNGCTLLIPSPFSLKDLITALGRAIEQQRTNAARQGS